MEENTTPKPSRRRFLALGIGSAVVLAAAGGVALGVKPAWSNGKLQTDGRAIFGAVLPAVLGEILPSGAAREVAVSSALSRIDALIGNLPPHTQTELAQLLSLLATGAGRRALAGLSTAWSQASAAEVQAAMQGMRLSSLSLKRQAYFALHDLSTGAYFSDASTWAAMGYPGPMQIS